MSIVETALKDAISQSLPESTAGELRKYIDQSTKTKEQLEKLTEKHKEVLAIVDTQDKRINTLLAELAEHNKRTLGLDKLEEDLNKRESEIAERERNLEVTILTNKLKCLTDAHDSQNRFLATLCRSPEVRTSTHKSIHTPAHYEDGQYLEDRYVNETTTETVEIND